jgi:hypothetical protein
MVPDTFIWCRRISCHEPNTGGGRVLVRGGKPCEGPRVEAGPVARPESWLD